MYKERMRISPDHSRGMVLTHILYEEEEHVEEFRRHPVELD